MSDQDRDFYVDILTKQLEDSLNLAVVTLDCNLSSSANGILVEIVEQLFHQLTILQSFPVQDSVLNIVNTKKQYRDHICEFAPDALEEYVNAYINVTGKRSNHLFIILKYCENFCGKKLNEFMLALIAAIPSSLLVQVIAVYSDCVPIPLLQLEKTTYDFIDMSIGMTASPYDMYDELMTRVLASQEVSVLLSPMAIAWVHESFSRKDCSICNALERYIE